jgi:hypothetical protein
MLIFYQGNHYKPDMVGGRREGAGRPKGAKNRRTVAVEQAMQVVAEKLKQAVPDAFEGDGVAYMQSVYRDPSFPQELRLDAAAKAARFERPTLAAIAMQQPPRARLDLSVLTAGEQEQLLGLMQKLMGRRAGVAAINGEAIR